MADIQSAAAEIRRGKKERKKKPQGKNITVCPITQGDHNKRNTFKPSCLSECSHCKIISAIGTNAKRHTGWQTK